MSKNKDDDILTLEMLKQAAKRIQETGWIVHEVKMPKRRTDDFYKANKRAERLLDKCNRLTLFDALKELFK